MAKELSPESKLYIKEEIENAKKEIKEEIEKVKSKSTKIFTTIVVVVGFLTGLGVYGGVVSYIKGELEGGTLEKLENDANAIVQDVTEQLGYASPATTANMYADISFEDMQNGVTGLYQ